MNEKELINNINVLKVYIKKLNKTLDEVIKSNNVDCDPDKLFVNFIVNIVEDKINNEKVFVFDSDYPDAHLDYLNNFCFMKDIKEEIKRRKLSNLWVNYFTDAMEQIILNTSFKFIKIKDVFIIYTDKESLLDFLEKGSMYQYLGY